MNAGIVFSIIISVLGLFFLLTPLIGIWIESRIRKKKERLKGKEW